jgi:ribonuclease BN (tRNA processing enzyme)
MKLIFLGSGSAFTVGSNNFQSNILLIHENGHKLLIDCGSDIRFSLYELGLSYLDITDIYVSHLHSDHVGGLEYIGLSCLFDPRASKPNLYVSRDVGEKIWINTLAGGMTAIEGDLACLDSFFTLHTIVGGGSFVWEDIPFYLVRVIHVNTKYYLMPAYGLFFSLAGSKIFLTTDTQFTPDTLSSYYGEADLIFQDCEISTFPTPVHAHYEQLVNLPPEIKKKMWLYGYQPGDLPPAEKDGFLGFVKRGQTFDF